MYIIDAKVSRPTVNILLVIKSIAYDNIYTKVKAK